MGFAVYEGFQLHQAVAPISAFEMCDSYRNEQYETILLSSNGGLVASSSDVGVMTRRIDETLALDTLFVVGGRGWNRALEDTALVNFIAYQSARVRRIATITTGAALYLATGLKPKRIAAHWARAREIAAVHPETEVTSDEPMIIEGKVYSATSSGSAVDIANAMITEDLGAATARRAMRELLPARSRGVQPRIDDRNTCRFLDLTCWARDNLDRITSINDLSERVGMLPTHLVPAFAAATGETPGKMLERLRVEAALDLMEETDLSLADIAVKVGFQNCERLRRSFIRCFGQSATKVREARSRSAQGAGVDGVRGEISVRPHAPADAVRPD